MAKQIKIGFDRTPAPVTKVFQQLVDIEGNLLFDDAGNPLVTEEDAVASGVLLSDNSLSVFVNNNVKPGGGGAIPIEEQFKETSEVSSSLLGVPRAEEQLSLFSDVATYGLDVDNWDATDFFSEPNEDPPEWYRKEHPVFGRRSNIKFNEGSDEQALFIKGFPTQYNFPRGPKELKESAPRNYMQYYMNFIAVGRYLYDRFKNEGHLNFAETNFISPLVANIVDVDDVKLASDGEVTFPKNANLLVLQGVDDFYDVEYGLSNLQDSFDAIERWTVAYDKIKDGLEFAFPILSQASIDLEKGAVGEDAQREIDDKGYEGFREFRLIKAFLASGDTRPGSTFLQEHYGILQSKRTFRYQPGRVSGFTFGTRVLAGNPARQDQTAEWGCANDTDMYMFQLKGSSFSIVRRSTKKMPSELLTRQGLTPPENFQSNNPRENPVTIKGIGNTELLWETNIPRANFNGDKLDGNGESGYIIRGFDDVTMYKIEFSWYGAIGAKFYAYVPVGVGECRWVLMHTFIIENGLGEPVLENPDFRFRYVVHTSNTEHIRSPMCLYKYGSSCYIDGGDEGTVRLATASTETKTFNDRTPILGILPKETLPNSVGQTKINFKKSYPSTLSVTTDKNVRLDFEEIKGSPQGVHYNYSPSLIMSGRNPRSRTLKLQYAPGGSGTGYGKFNIIQPARSQNALGFNDLSGFTDLEHEFLVDISGTAVTIAGSLSASDLYPDFPIIGIESISASGEVTVNANLTTYDLPAGGSKVRVSGTNVGTSSLQTGDYIISVNPNPAQNTQQFTLRTLQGNSISITGGTLSGLTISALKPYPSVFTGLQVGDTLRISGNDHIIKNFATNSSVSLNKTGLVLETAPASSTSVSAKLIHKINVSEKYAHVIADGVYGRYIDENNFMYKRGTDAGGVSYSIIEGESEDAETLSGGTRQDQLSTTSSSSVFEGTLSSYNTVVGSDTPIQKNKFKIHFLNPDAKDTGAGSRHFAEFLVGVTPYKPLAHNDSTRSDGDPQVKFNKPSGMSEFDRNEFPTIEYCHAHTDFDQRKRITTREADRFYGNRLNIDPRLDRNDNVLDVHESSPGVKIPNANGDMSTVQGEVSVTSNTFLSGAAGLINNFLDPISGQQRIKIVFETGSAPGPDEIIPDFSEVGINFGPLTLDGTIGGTPVKFRSKVIYPQGNESFNPYAYLDNGGAGTTHFATLNALTGDNRAIQTKTITLKDDWRAVSIKAATATSDSEERFKSKKFIVSKAVSFNTQPLYPVFALGDFSKVNCIVIEEISEDGSISTHTPTFVKENALWNSNISIDNPKSSVNTKTPSAFNSQDRVSTCRYDTSTLNPLRPGNVIYSTFVGENETTSLELDNVFARDRKGISRGALNNRAVFITATSLDNADGNLQLSLTSKEQ